MARYPAQLQSANLNEFGIVYADEIQGHKTVATLNALYAITDPILSKSVVNTNNDAIGQEWFVVSEDCYYRLDNWANRHAASGWTKLQVVDTEFNSLSTHGADKIKNFTTSPNTVTLNYNTWRSSTVNEDGTAVINAATQSAAGVLTAADKTKLDGLNTDSINDISVTSNANKATITFVSDNGNKEDISTTIDFPISTSSAAGTMSAKDKTELDRINTANFALGAVTPAASTVGIAASKTNVTDGTTAANNITLPAATQSAAGVLTAADKTKLDGLNTDSINDISVTSNANKATITFVSDNGNKEDISTTIDFPISTSSAAGTMSAKDKTELDRINTANFALGAVTPAASTVGIAASKTNVTDGTTAANNITLPAATQSAAGVLTAADKTKVDRITGTNHVISQPTTTATSRVITITGINPTDNKAVSSSITLPEVSETQAGLASASDKKTLNAIKTLRNSSHLKDDNCWTRTASNVAINFTCTDVSGNSTNTNAMSKHSVNIGAASSTLAGVMTSTDKTELDRITTANFALGAVTPTASNVGIAATKTTISTGASVANNITLPAATSTTAGVMTSTQVTTLTTVDNRKLFGIVKGDTGTATAEAAVDTLTISGGTDLETVATDTTNNDVLTVNHSSVTRTNAADATATYTLPASGGSVALPKVVKSVTSSATGHVTATSSETPSIVHGALTTAAATGTALTPGFGGKINVVTSASNDGHGHITGITTTSVTIPSSIASTTANGLMSTADKTKLDTTLPNLISSNKTTIDNYTVNGYKISTNPVITGANTKVTGYSKPTTTGAIAATDSINGALGKLEKKLDDEVTNRTNAVSNLTNTVNNNKTTIDNYTVGGIKISANPKVANGTNTTVSTANSTITWSLNSTISLTRVNASSGFYQTSDKRLKSDIKPLEHTLEEICSIPTDSFILGGKKDLGTIAQELEPTFPELVTDAELKQSDVPNPENFETIEKDGETYVLVKEVDYAKMSVLAIEGIKLLKAEIDELKKQLLDK